jgi:Rrf2 family transcriptional regulator, iron-sulfur cluster assembly transcription factor
MLTTKGRYAVMAILEVPPRDSLKPVKLLEISLAQNIPLNYLEQIFAKLKKAEVVRSVRGPGGGYILNKESDRIKIATIIDAVDENIEMTRCSLQAKTHCLPNNIKCKTHYLWKGLGDQIRNYFEAISIEDIIKGRYDLPGS